MLNDLQTVFEEITGDYETELKPEMVINEDMNLSSIGKIQLIYAIEDKFNIDIPSKAIRKFITVNDIIDFLNENVG